MWYQEGVKSIKYITRNNISSLRITSNLYVTSFFYIQKISSVFIGNIFPPLSRNIAILFSTSDNKSGFSCQEWSTYSQEPSIYFFRSITITDNSVLTSDYCMYYILYGKVRKLYNSRYFANIVPFFTHNILI